MDTCCYTFAGIMPENQGKLKADQHKNSRLKANKIMNEPELGKWSTLDRIRAYVVTDFFRYFGVHCVTEIEIFVKTVAYTIQTNPFFVS